MGLQFETVASLVKSFLPTFKAPRAEISDAIAGAEPNLEPLDPRTIAPEALARLRRLSPEAEVALAPLNLPPDGPFSPGLVLRAKLTPEAAARNFVRWAQALDLAGTFSRRSIYSLYCEFSEVDHRPPVRDVPFLESLARTEGVLRERRTEAGSRMMHQPWLWTIEPAPKTEVPEAILAECEEAPSELPGAQQQPAPKPLPAQASTARPTVVLGRFVLDDDHPFSPAKLREHAKGARRARLNAAASRKQRGALRRAA